MKLYASLVTIALALALAAPAAARARRAHIADPAFPMNAVAYRKLVDKRIDSIWSVIEKKLDRRGVSPERKKAIRQLLDDVSGDLRTEVAKATADGTVTHVEAARARVLVSRLRSKLRARLALEKKRKAHNPKSPVGTRLT